jgi:xanthine dehydrogenase YagT iron-sulfur-binding subunit
METYMNDAEASSPGTVANRAGHPSRRDVVVGATAATMTASVGNGALAQSRNSGATNTVNVSFVVNGTPQKLSFDPRSSLLDVLRERLALTGAKKGCDHGQCGACTVHIDGRRVVSCLTPAVQVDGRQVTTIEGLAGSNGELHPMQQAFIDHDALQCGFCTPGQIMAAIACVREGHASSPEQIREYMSGNLCRCGAYVGIVAAIEDAAPKMQRA